MLAAEPTLVIGGEPAPPMAPFSSGPTASCAAPRDTGVWSSPPCALDDGSIVDAIGIFPDADIVATAAGPVPRPLFGERTAMLARDSAYLTAMRDDFTFDRYVLSGRPVARMRRDYTVRSVAAEMMEQ